jgi:hypothetical protein
MWKQYSALGAIGLAGCLTVGCATTERLVYVQPECTVPAMPQPPEVDASALDALDDDTYWVVRRRDRVLTDSLLEHRAVLRAVCE